MTLPGLHIIRQILDIKVPDAPSSGWMVRSAWLHRLSPLETRIFIKTVKASLDLVSAQRLWVTIIVEEWPFAQRNS